MPACIEPASVIGASELIAATGSFADPVGDPVVGDPAVGDPVAGDPVA